MYKDMDKITFKNGEEPYISAPNLNKLQENAEKAIKGRTPTVELLTVSDTAPTTCKTGDKYYNTSTNKIYTATAENTWGTTGEDPTNLDIYVDLEHTKLYYYDGTNFKSYGGGSGTKEVGYTDEELEGTEKILIEEDDTDGIGIVDMADVVQVLTGNETNKVPSVKTVKDAITTIKNEILNTVYPIGAIYLSINSTNPKSLFGGTWEQIAQGRTLVGVNTADSDFSVSGKTGGEKAHTLTVNEMPSHSHKYKLSYGSSGSGSQNTGFNYAENTVSTFDGENILATGGSQAHNNLQPYFTCYIWKRTA